MQQRWVVEFPDKRTEIILREFLLRTANRIRLTAVKWTEVRWLVLLKRHGGDDELLFRKMKEHLQKDFLKKIINNKRFDDLEQRKSARYEHYVYRLSPAMKKKFGEETLFWATEPPASKNFYGFEDPTFYQNKQKIGCVISHEGYVFLYLTKKEKKGIERRKVKVVEVPEHI